MAASTHTGNWNSWADGFKENSYLPRVGYKLTFYITPGAGANPMMLNIIKRAVDKAKSLDHFPFKDADVLVLDSREKAKEQDLCRIGDHPFQFYTTWMKSADYELIWKNRPNLPLDYPKLSEQFRKLLQRIGVVEVKPQFRHLKWRSFRDGQDFPKGSAANDLAKLCYPVVEFEVHIMTENF